jgi:Arrestin (or S-antigen), N-terminal domain
MGKIKLQEFVIQLEDPTKVYYPGDTINGKCVIALDDGEISLSDVTLQLIGVAKTDWAEFVGTGNHQRARLLEGKVEMVKKSHRFNGSDIITQGVHQLPFAFQLPSE